MACAGYEWTVPLENADDIAPAVEELDEETAE
ncbi:hypothetical protein HNR06_001841 [Nocardiopsis arvandica]|uniref:Uncharacterized protein n=1 Tax=Nocardiopsis sinuspersici TaxID=501010 RepID=A0A7Y9XAJ8_9ACTN|nr:hypothetical protein [Nocardiopsis sinuspersici]